MSRRQADAGTPRRRGHASTQTSDSALEELANLKRAVAAQGAELEELRAELPRLQAQSERTAVAESNASLAAERDEQHAARMRHLQRAHQTALNHARSAADAVMGNELAKQRDEIVRALSEGQASALGDAMRSLSASEEEAAKLRAKLKMTVDDLSAAHHELREKRQSLQEERAVVAGLQLEVAALKAEETARLAAARKQSDAEAAERGELVEATKL